ncbi:MAG: N-acetylglucosamine-6-phosphate deacetylase [Candidatus Korobacteraceae bacterium]
MSTVLLARQLLTPLEHIEDAALVINDGIVAAVGQRNAMTIPSQARVVDLGDSILTPGLIDIHVHGGAGHDVMEGSDESLAAIERLMVRHGVTSYCPTTVTAPLDRTLESLENLAKAAERASPDVGRDPTRAQPIGIHLEGPFLSHARRGVHPALHLQPASRETFNQMWDAAAGRIRVLTLAPELDGALDLIVDASRRGVCVSIGHSNATLEQGIAGIRAGARHATHTFNSMRRFDHRDPGLLGAILSDRSMTADIVADGIHVAPIIVDLFVRCKGVEGAVLITDGISATGMPDGTYRLGAFEVQVRDSRCESHGKLAGSVLTLDRAVRNMMSFAKLGFHDSIRMATLNPARVLGIEHRKGVLKPGADADIAVFSPAGEVLRTVVGGMLN